MSIRLGVALLSLFFKIPDILQYASHTVFVAALRTLKHACSHERNRHNSHSLLCRLTRVQRLRRSVACHCKPAVNFRQVLVVFMVNEVALGQVFSRYFGFFLWVSLHQHCTVCAPNSYCYWITRVRNTAGFHFHSGLKLTVFSVTCEYTVPTYLPTYLLIYLPTYLFNLSYLVCLTYLMYLIYPFILSIV